MVVTRRRNDSEVSIADDLSTETPIRRSTRLRGSQNVTEAPNKVEVSGSESSSSQSKVTRGRISRNRNDSEMESENNSSADGNQKTEKRITRSKVDGKTENEPKQFPAKEAVRSKSVLSNDTPSKRRRTTSTQSLDESSTGKLATPVTRRSSRRLASVDLGLDSGVGGIETPRLRGRSLKVSAEPDLEVLSEEVRPVAIVQETIKEVSEIELIASASSNDLSKNEPERISGGESQSVKGEELITTNTKGFEMVEEIHEDKADESSGIGKPKYKSQLKNVAEAIPEIVSSVKCMVEKHVITTTDKPDIGSCDDEKVTEDTYMEEQEVNLTGFSLSVDENERLNLEEKGTENEVQCLKGEVLNPPSTEGFDIAEENNKKSADGSLKIEKTREKSQLKEIGVPEIIFSDKLVIEKYTITTTDKLEKAFSDDRKVNEDSHMEEKEANLSGFSLSADENEKLNLEEKGTKNKAQQVKCAELNSTIAKRHEMTEENCKNKADESPETEKTRENDKIKTNNEAIPEIRSSVELLVAKHIITTTGKPEIRFCSDTKVGEDAYMEEKEANLSVSTRSVDESEKSNFEEKEKENLHNTENQVMTCKVVDEPVSKLGSTTGNCIRFVAPLIVPRGKNVSGRFWREPKERFKNNCKDKGLKSSREQYEKNKIERLRIKLLEDRKKEEKRIKIEELRKRQQLNSQRKEINDRRGETVQAIKNTLKLKTLSKKQRRMYQKRDTTGVAKSN
ncbi:hypothetical protein QYM36_014322 [Artemia franciscana]|uniref:Coiled-coil domain-containing protein 86 n=2 Tax=Artemia franciscana TaxID=6661 RepID=A0AA88HJG4_ARTSF|nr:hypothetical protein QYM36_014322 [Artemia franciscana]